ncbi:hypothetical protein [Amycolatopsis cihanbeyliensis]|uniref:hypothetical protein n=1 Tax=Amycolatopsis cihanbeyliensis TaxID=1128664 RepID=UPI00114E4FE2|nr:hypothetical protein [Amycolatopsis cihanbeyliensis]
MFIIGALALVMIGLLLRRMGRRPAARRLTCHRPSLRIPSVGYSGPTEGINTDLQNWKIGWSKVFLVLCATVVVIAGASVTTLPVDLRRELDIVLLALAGCISAVQCTVAPEEMRQAGGVLFARTQGMFGTYYQAASGYVPIS